jgi:hypothetical protein
MEVLNKEPVSPRALNATLSKDVEAICRKCLTKNPDNRYASMRDMIADLDCLLNGHPVHARGLRLWWHVHKPGALLIVGLGAGIAASSGKIGEIIFAFYLWGCVLLRWHKLSSQRKTERFLAGEALHELPIPERASARRNHPKAILLWFIHQVAAWWALLFEQREGTGIVGTVAIVIACYAWAAMRQSRVQWIGALTFVSVAAFGCVMAYNGVRVFSLVASEENKLSLPLIWVGVVITAYAIGCLVSVFQPTILRPGGIDCRRGVIPWRNIYSYKWLDLGDQTDLSLRTERDSFVIPVPASEKQKVEAILVKSLNHSGQRIEA